MVLFITTAVRTSNPASCEDVAGSDILLFAPLIRATRLKWSAIKQL
jgi:hypothetical protein